MLYTSPRPSTHLHAFVARGPPSEPRGAGRRALGAQRVEVSEERALRRHAVEVRRRGPERAKTIKSGLRVRFLEFDSRRCGRNYQGAWERQRDSGVLTPSATGWSIPLVNSVL